MSKRLPGLPPPVLSEINAGFWKAAGQGRLVIQRCSDCRAHRHPPTAVCYRCQSDAWSWDEVPGTGRVFTYTWVYHPAHPGLAHLGVYNVAVVELDGTEGDPVRLVSNVLDVGTEALAIGMPVEVAFDPVDDHVALPVFRPRRS